MPTTTKMEIKEDSLRTCMERVKQHCLENGITLFNGYPENHPGGEAIWEGLEANGWKDYINAFIATGSKLLLYSYQECELENHDLQVFANEKLPLLVEEEQSAIRTELAKMEDRLGHIASFDLYFLHEGVCFSYNAQAEWYNSYDYIIDLITGPIYDTDDEVDDDSNCEQRLGNEAVEKYARELLSMDKYLEAKTSRDRKYIARMEMLEKGIIRADSRYLITERAEDLYETEIFAKKQEALRVKVEKLAAEKYTKIKAAKVLEISMTELNKHWP